MCGVERVVSVEQGTREQSKGDMEEVVEEAGSGQEQEATTDPEQRQVYFGLRRV